MRTTVIHGLLCMALVGWSTEASAQSASKTLSGVTCPGDGCLSVTISTDGQFAVQVTGTFTGTVVFEKTVDDVTWAPLTLTSLTGASVSLTTTTGVWTGPVEGSAKYRMRFSIYWSGSATVTYNLVSSSSNFAAKYVLNQVDASLPNAQSLGDLPAGLVKVVITPGVTDTGTFAAAVAGTDYVAPTGSGTGLSGIGLLSNPLSQFAPTTSAELAGVLSDETGSGGGFVRGTSPTITTPVLTAPTIARIANLTTNGVIVTTNGDGTLAIGSALPACANGQSPLYVVDTWVCATLANTAGSYSNPSWITALAWSKLTGTPTTISGYGITNAVATDGSYANPSWVTSLAWSKLTGTPTTFAGYGITDIFARGTLTASNPFAFTQTWNDAGATFEGLTLDITDTASADESPYIHLRANGNTILRINAAGTVNGKYALLGATGIRFGGYDDVYNAAYQIGNDINAPGAIRFQSPGSEFVFGFLNNVSIHMGFGNRGGLFNSSATGGTCVISNSACQLTHNVAAGAWESAVNFAAPKVGGTTGLPSVSGDGTIGAGSTNVDGFVTSTATGAVSIVVTFHGTAFSKRPSCFATNQTTGEALAAIATTTTLTLTGTATTSDVITYGCLGR